MKKSEPKVRKKRENFSRIIYDRMDQAEALLALEANGGDVAKTAKQLGISKGTLYNWTRGRGVRPKTWDTVDGIRPDLVEQLRIVAERMISQAMDRAGDLNARDAMVAAAIAIDKMQLISHKPTSIAGQVSLDDEERWRKVEELAERVERQRLLTKSGGEIISVECIEHSPSAVDTVPEQSPGEGVSQQSA